MQYGEIVRFTMTKRAFAHLYTNVKTSNIKIRQITVKKWGCARLCMFDRLHFEVHVNVCTRKRDSACMMKTDRKSARHSVADA